EHNGHGVHVAVKKEVKDLKLLLKNLKEIEKFYDCIGGIIGYEIMVLELLTHSTCENQTTNWSQHIHDNMNCQFLEIHAPSGLDLSKDTDYASQAAMWGIEVSILSLYVFCLTRTDKRGCRSAIRLR
ncbi:UTP--glucose-1-phosphate uridylyltransferase 3, chloroplastic, partial [Linum perenne]